MMLEQGATYRAVVSLGMLESMASNETVAGKFREVGFVNVSVTGNGGTRHVTGTWPNPSRAANLPSQVTGVQRIS